MLAFVPPSRAVFSFPSLSCVRRVAAETSAEGSRLSTSISIHAPHVGSDPASCGHRPPFWRHFNPRSPCGERPCRELRTEDQRHFNPRSPCGERHSESRSATPAPKFQSTLPVWGATLRRDRRVIADGISIHAPRVGSDPS